MASLTQRSGALGKRLAAHLLRRTTYHITKAQIDAVALQTADQAVNDLLTFPVFHQSAGPISKVNGATWCTEVPNTDNHGGLSGSDKRSAAYSWWMNELFQDTSARGRLANFHKSIWTIGRIQNGISGFSHFSLVLFYAKGDIRALAKKMVLDIDMLYFLDNRDNKNTSPNENFAREFLELFTILKGPQIGPTDYTNYTEADITEAARVFTGFTASKNTTFYNNLDPDTNIARGNINFSKHDLGDKTFSSAFGGLTITGAVDATDAYRELDDFINMIFAQLATARSYCRRLYRYFVSDIIDAEIETDIIEPLAVELHTNNYNLEPTIARLLKSVHFYDEDDSDSTDDVIGGKLKSPLMLNLQMLSYLEMGSLLPDPITQADDFWDRIWSSRILGHNMTETGQDAYPLTVEGFPGYFKEPNFSKNWFDASTIAKRYLIMQYLLIGKSVRNNLFLTSSNAFQPDISALVATNYTSQDNADALVLQILEDLFPEMPDGYQSPGDVSKRYNYFREALLGGLSTINWMFEWQNAQGGDTNAQASVKVALDRLFRIMMSSPEFQTF